MKRTLAIIGIVLILSLYLVSFISAFFASKSAPGLFLASVFSTVVIPIMIYGFITVYKYVHRDDQKDNEIPTDETK